ncbi:NADP-dependent oxidoreductase [Pseudomaricurvus hydrocarbonicus]
MNNLELVNGNHDVRPLKSGEIRIRNLLFQCAPTMRNWMSEPSNSLYRTIDLGTPVQALAACRVVESRNSRYPVGSRIIISSCWSEYDIIDVSELSPKFIPEGISAIESVGKLGINSLTAYFGITRIGQPRPGETLVVSGAAGSTGSVAAQIGRLKGCRVIGIAGGKNKCDWLMNECGLDGAIDYHTEDVNSALKDHCPNGIDIFYDNVGGQILQAAVDNMAKFGRIILCGQIAAYNQDGPAPAFSNMMRLIYGSIHMQGFLYSDYLDDIPKALNDLTSWMQSGDIITRLDVRSGFENLPSIFNALFDGSNQGSLLAVIDDDAHALA